MNGSTHSAFARILANLATYHGLAPRAHDLLLADRDLFARSTVLPDNVIDVAIRMPVGELATEILGHATAPLCHFEPGYDWGKDPSLSVAGALVDAAAHLCGATVELRGDGLRPPQVPMAELCPFAHSLALQSHREVTHFRFPSASQMAAFYGRGARLWLADRNVPGWLGCAGYALHLVQDCCIPHHARGALLAGHTAFENRLEQHFEQDFGDGTGDVNPDLIAAVRRDLLAVQDCRTVAELCIRCAGWSRAKWPDLDALGNPDNDVSIAALAICTRALAASVRAIELMTEAP